jgi:hypothetical protein
VGCCEHDNETSSYLKGSEFLVQLSDYKLLKKDSTPWSYSVKVKVKIKLSVCFI